MDRFIDIVIDEFLQSRTAPTDSELAQIEAALYFEECFHIQISDEEIASETFGSADSIRRFINSKVGG